MSKVTLLTTQQSIDMQKELAVFALGQSRQNPDADWELYKKIVNVNHHENQLRHFHLMFHITGISSRAHVYLVRHVFTTPTVQSLRYTQPKSFEIVMPESYSNLPEKIYEEVTESINMAADVYRRMVALGVKKEDACYILPQGTKINLTYETNMQQLRHIISQRIAPGAHWEIRDVMKQMVSACKKMDYIKDII